MKADIWCDGAARKKPNPGPAGAGYLIEIQGQERLEGSTPLGLATNNVAEYEAVVLALRAAADRGATEAHLRTDSTVVAGHFHRPETCKAEHLKVLLEAVHEQVDRFPGGVKIERIPREQNKDADRLARAARDTSELSRKKWIWDESGIAFLRRGNQSIERLWAPWRGEYVKQASKGEDQGCLFCELQKQDDEEALILSRTEHSFAVLNRYPYNSGHLMLAPLRHVGELEDVKDDENLDMQRLLQRCIRALKEAMEPDGFNLGMNLGRVAGAGVPDHLHWHVVPRWNGDTNFMPTVGQIKVLPESLKDTHKKLHGVLKTST